MNPAGLGTVARVQLANAEDMNRAVKMARASFESGVWREQAPAERARVIRDAADRLEKRIPELAKLLTEELGCPIWFSEKAHVPNPVRHLRY